MFMLDQDSRRLMSELRVEQLSRAARSSRRRWDRRRRRSLSELLGPAAYRRPQLEG
jgi:hypothetical protein